MYIFLIKKVFAWNLFLVTMKTWKPSWQSFWRFSLNFWLFFADLARLGFSHPIMFNTLTTSYCLQQDITANNKNWRSSHRVSEAVRKHVYSRSSETFLDNAIPDLKIVHLLLILVLPVVTCIKVILTNCTGDFLNTHVWWIFKTKHSLKQHRQNFYVTKIFKLEINRFVMDHHCKLF